MTESTEMTLQDHALQELNAIDAGFAELSTKYVGAVFDVTTTKGMAEAKSARQEIRQVRYNAENVRKENIGELTKISKAINARAEEIKGRVLSIEGPVNAQIEAEEERKELERQAREEEAEAHRQRMTVAIANIRAYPQLFTNATVEEIDKATEALLADKLDFLDEVYLPDGQRARDESIADLAVMRAQRVQADEDAAERARLREQNEALLRQQEELQRQLREQQEAAAAERAAREAQDRARKEREDAERREAERVERERREAEQAQLRAEQEARDRVAREEQAERDRQARAEAEERERQLAEQRAAAERAEIESATLREACAEGVELLASLGQREHLTTRKMVAAIERDSR